MHFRKPKRIILIRHGQSEGNADPRVYAEKPDYTLKLTPQGIQEAYEVGATLKSIIGEERAQFYVSPFWRTRMTFEQIRRHFDPKKVRHYEEPRIREQEWGHLRDGVESKRVKEERDAYGVFYYRIPDGESAADVFDRMSDFLDTLYRDFQKEDYPENAVLISHGMSIRLFIMRWFHLTVETFEKMANPKNCALIEMHLNENNTYDLVTKMEEYETVYHPYRYEG